MTHIGTEKAVTVAKKQGKIMFSQQKTSNSWMLLIIWVQARVTKIGLKRMEVPRQNRDRRTNGLRMLTNWTMKVCRRIGVGFRN